LLAVSLVKSFGAMCRSQQIYHREGSAVGSIWHEGVGIFRNYLGGRIRLIYSQSSC
jgi:hypothetical protein